MRFDRLSALFALLVLTPAQTLSGLTFDGQDAVNLVWASDGQTAGRYDFYLCAGDESTGSYESLERVINDGAVAPGDWLSFRVDRTVGGNDLNAYFLKVIPADQKEQWFGFTSHFTLTNMKGSFSNKVSKAIKSMKPIPLMGLVDETQPLEPVEDTPSFNSSALNNDIHEEPTQPALQFPTPTNPSDYDDHFELRKRLAVDAHNIPYGEQTGPTKYAPMPKMAGTTIAPGSPTPQYPPFPFSIATTYMPAPTVQYTDTAYLTFTTHSIENTAAPAPAPTLDKRMQRWLERWKD
ncbi:hypothetical protein N7532_003428 [Penicillium argentinense]|uniref:Yeast cell wall synthesis Kre9/Knh1 C-terminal domain-containing protein n=1 Tax=Penicillium argentinense TaxID=1131581 RepID=A0A9W9KE02_9EURO|nr:uncharacterized protein N7532_003428 [Penicillium argentinense]KAJ5102899.1 hypothetical protein N7532_003428 [Penicillium argentinense]